ncbi:HNH endonuclease [Only Syngen Nebraska virus 5]|uniref:HNH endonuclease n=1 Tax=Only Syngen Nebraska virus 5 TaxID=1917232 RepID=UPI000901193E|nr:HNH endonuclease [Only Syngen Nebraska virus 5]APC25591.1 Zn-finger containing protein [Only Syngen Nebraska virus 5]
MKCPKCKKEHDEKTKKCESCKEYARKYYKQNADYYKEYRVENAEKHKKYTKEYRKNNSENIKEHKKQYRTLIRGMFMTSKSNARNRNIRFEITEDFVGHLTDKKCHYCRTETTDTIRNGIDRLDNTEGYIESNCVSCCGTCNKMKQCLDPRTFVERCAQVSLHNGFGGTVCEFWNNITGYSYARYKSRMISRDIEFQLTKEQYDALRQRDCTYCGRSCTESHTNGIDRVDSTRGYANDNCVSCCADCNYSKRNMTADDFIQKCVMIASKKHTFPEIPRCVRMICRNRPKS